MGGKNVQAIYWQDRIVQLKPFEKTPLKLRLIGFKKYRRWENVRVLVIYDVMKWVYYTENQMQKHIEINQKGTN